MTDSKIEAPIDPARTAGPATPSSSATPSAPPSELAAWIEDRLDQIAERWIAELGSRLGRGRDETASILADLIHVLVSFLPIALGPYRALIEPLWQRAAELYGRFGVKRGLASGEIIEEFQLLREAVIRFLYADPPAGGTLLSLRDVLRLNRMVDRGVTHASIGHTDDLFFALFQGTGVPSTVTPDVLDEVTEQLTAIRDELDQAVRKLKD